MKQYSFVFGAIINLSASLIEYHLLSVAQDALNFCSASVGMQWTLCGTSPLARQKEEKIRFLFWSKYG